MTEWFPQFMVFVVYLRPWHPQKGHKSTVKCTSNLTKRRINAYNYLPKWHSSDLQNVCLVNDECNICRVSVCLWVGEYNFRETNCQEILSSQSQLCITNNVKMCVLSAAESNHRKRLGRLVWTVWGFLISSTYIKTWNKNIKHDILEVSRAVTGSMYCMCTASSGITLTLVLCLWHLKYYNGRWPFITLPCNGDE